MSVIEFILAYYDWYLLMGLMCSVRYLAMRLDNGVRGLLIVFFLVWDGLFWPADVMRNLWILKQ